MHTKTDREDKTFLNNVVIFLFFAHKNYSRSFITLRLNHWYHIDYFKDLFTTFLGLERGNCVVVYAESESSQISYLDLFSEDERRYYRFNYWQTF